jgi:hypothetical protein
MIDIGHLIDLGFIVIAAFICWELNGIQKLMYEIAHKHNNLSENFNQFSQAVVEDLEEVADALNEEPRDD